MALLDRKCQECGTAFSGGPRAYYCPACRIERKKKTDLEAKLRAREGLTRKIGSSDKCERCGRMYIVNAGLQRFCTECQPIHAAEHDRETSLDFYHENKEQINPVRYERKNIDPKRNCAACGKEFEHGGTSRVTCSEECKRSYDNAMYNVIYGPRYRSKRS